MNRDEKNAEGLSVPGIDRTKGASAFLTRRKIANRFASVNGGEVDRRPVSILSAEIVLWLLAVLVVLFCAGWIGRGPFDLAKISLLGYIVWRVSLPVLVHSGFRLIATLGMIVELGLWPGFCRYGMPWDGHLALCGTHLLPLVLLWLPPSIRWSARRNFKGWVWYFADNPLSRNWFDIVDPSVVLGIATVDIGKPEYLADRKAIKNAFKAFGLVVNAADGLAVTFPAASAGKMLYQSGVDIHGIAGAFKSLFESSIRVWNEREVPMEGHKFHFNVGAYRNYLNKFTDGKGEYYIRFTVREIGKNSSVHASTISEVAIYGKNEGARTDSHPENPEDGSKAPFTDNKIALYLGYVNGGGNERG